MQKNWRWFIGHEQIHKPIADVRFIDGVEEKAALTCIPGLTAGPAAQGFRPNLPPGDICTIPMQSEERRLGPPRSDTTASCFWSRDWAACYSAWMLGSSQGLCLT